MIKISKTHHVLHPFSQGDISLSKKQQRNTKFLFLVPIIGVFIFYRVTYALKIKAARTLDNSQHNIGVDFKKIVTSSSSPSTPAEERQSITPKRLSTAQISSERDKEIEQQENVQSSSEQRQEIEQQENVQSSSEQRQEIEQQENVQSSSEKRQEVEQQENVQSSSDKGKEIEQQENVQSSSDKGKEIEQQENVQSSSDKGKEIEPDFPSNIYLKDKSNNVTQTLDEVVKQLLLTPGFVFAEEFPINRCHTGETVEQIQGTPLFRKEARAAARQYIDAFSYQALIDNAYANIEACKHLLFKRVGHIFGLEGIIFGINPEGCCEDITIPFIASSFKDFVEKEISNLPSWLESSAKWIQEELLNVITSDTFADYDVQQIFRDLQREDFQGLVAGGSGWDWHSTITGFVGNIGFTCNRGAQARDRFGVELFLMKNREGFQFLDLKDVFTRQNFNRKDFFSRPAMIHELNGTPIHFENMPKQESGNCTYRSVEAYLLVLLALAYAKDKNKENFYAALEDPEVLKEAFAHAQIVFDQWVHYDRTQAFKFLMNAKEEIFQRMRSSVMDTEVYRQMTQNERERQRLKRL